MVDGLSVVNLDLLASHCLQSNLVVLLIVAVLDDVDAVVEEDIVVDEVVEEDVDDEDIVVGEDDVEAVVVVVLVVEVVGVIAFVDHLLAETSSSCQPNVGISVVSSSCWQRKLNIFNRKIIFVFSFSLQCINSNLMNNSLLSELYP